MGTPHSDGKGGTTGTIAFYGGPSMVQVVSVSFSGDGKVLAVGSTPGMIDVWSVDERRKVRTFKGGVKGGLSADGRLLAKDGNGIEVWDLSTGKVKTKIPWVITTAASGSQNNVEGLAFSPDGTLLAVAANGLADSIYEVASSRKLTTLDHSQNGEFSRDGAMFVGANGKHLSVWSTKDWSMLRDFPNGPDYVVKLAVSPNAEFAIIGGGTSARLVRLSDGSDVATVGKGFTTFAAFNESGRLLFTYTDGKFGVFDLAGTELCSAEKLGNGQMAVSAQSPWMASGFPSNGSSVNVWNLDSALAACGIPADPNTH